MRNTTRSVRVRASELEGASLAQHRRQKTSPCRTFAAKSLFSTSGPLLHQLPAFLDELRPLEEEFSDVLVPSAYSPKFEHEETP